MKFLMEVEMGNEGMSEEPDLAGALRKLADKIERYGAQPGDSMKVYDYNGNPVGQARMEGE